MVLPLLSVAWTIAIAATLATHYFGVRGGLVTLVSSAVRT